MKKYVATKTSKYLMTKHISYFKTFKYYPWASVYCHPGCYPFIKFNIATPSEPPVLNKDLR